MAPFGSKIAVGVGAAGADWPQAASNGTPASAQPRRSSVRLENVARPATTSDDAGSWQS